MLEKIYNYFTGYVTVKVKTNQPERFLNITVLNNIYLWDLKRISENEMTFNISPKGFKRLRKIVYEVPSKVKILNKKGFFLFKRKIKSKKIILSGIIPVIFVMMFLSSLILDIEITGNETTDTSVILEKLSEINLQKFKFRSNIDSDEISVKLINELDNIAWVGVREQGTKLLIEIKERNMPPRMVPKDIPCHIVAKKDGVIKKMNIKNGEPLVSLNQVVVKDQVLISGIINTKFDDLRYVHSMADVIANTWWESFLDIKLCEYKKNYTGNKDKKIFLKVFNKEFDLNFGRIIPFYNYDEAEKRYIFGFMELDIKTYDEYTLNKTPISEDEAITAGKEALTNELYKTHTKEEIKNIEFQSSFVDDETRKLRIIANIEEDIGSELKIEPVTAPE